MIRVRDMKTGGSGVWEQRDDSRVALQESCRRRTTFVAHLLRAVPRAASAWPITAGSTGTRAFCADESGVIRYNTTGTQITTTDTACQAVTNVLQ